MRAPKMRFAAVVAVLAGTVAGQISSFLPNGCYLVTTVITYDAGSLSFVSMTRPTSGANIDPGQSTSSAASTEGEPTMQPTLESTSFGSMSMMSSLSSGTSSSVPTSASSGGTSAPSSGAVVSTSTGVLPAITSTSQTLVATTTTSDGPAPSLEAGDALYITVNVPDGLRKRAIFYIGFDQAGVSILVDTKALAAIFVIDDAGNLLSNGRYIGTSTTDGTASLQQFDTPPVSPYFWSVDGGSIFLGPATFCTTAQAQFFVVYGDSAAEGCNDVVIAAEPGPEQPLTTATLTAATTSLSNSAVTANPVSSSTSRSTRTSSTSASTAAGISTSSTRLTGASSNPQSAPPSSTESSTTSAVVQSSTLSTSRSASTSSNAQRPSSSSVTTSFLSSSSLRPSSAGSGAGTSSGSIVASTVRSSQTSSTTSVQSISPIISSSTLSSIVSTVTASSTSVVPPSSTSSATRTPVRCTARRPAATVSPLTGKRGLAYGQVSTLQYYSPPTQVSWAYNYFSKPNNTNNVGVFPPSSQLPLHFYPLLFNDKPGATDIWEANANFAIDNYGTDALFSFNEPDLCSASNEGACMNVSQAVTAYEAYMQPFAACGVRLVAPAVTNAGNRGMNWLKEFMGNATARNLTVDVINLHWYASPYNQQYFEDYMTAAHNMYPDKPIWITEYGIDNPNYLEAATRQFIRNTTYWVDRQPWIEKVAWFGNYRNNLLNANADGLSPRGELYSTYNGTGYVYGFNKRQVGDGEGEGEEVPQAPELPVEVAPEESWPSYRDAFGDDWWKTITGG